MLLQKNVQLYGRMDGTIKQLMVVWQIGWQYDRMDGIWQNGWKYSRWWWCGIMDVSMADMMVMWEDGLQYDMQDGCMIFNFKA